MVDVDDEVADLQIAEVGEEVCVAERRRSWRVALLLEDVGLGPELQPGVGQAEARDRWPTPTSTDAVVRVLGALDRRGADLVVGEQLDRALGAARRVRDEDHGFAGLARRARISATQSGTRPANSSAG